MFELSGTGRMSSAAPNAPSATILAVSPHGSSTAWMARSAVWTRTTFSRARWATATSSLPSHSSPPTLYVPTALWMILSMELDALGSAFGTMCARTKSSYPQSRTKSSHPLSNPALLHSPGMSIPVPSQGDWTMVWVDGYFPCYVSNDPHASKAPKPIYASSANRREIWPMVRSTCPTLYLLSRSTCFYALLAPLPSAPFMLTHCDALCLLAPHSTFRTPLSALHFPHSTFRIPLSVLHLAKVVEKAYAKLHGTFQAIGGGGRISQALQALTGGNAWTVPTSCGATKLWSGLCRAVEDPNVLVGAGTRHDADAALRRGIIDGHAYSVMHAVEVDEAEGGGGKGGGGKVHRLLLLRNPWGHGEWTGPWSDSSRLWEQHPKCKAAVGNLLSRDDDGDCARFTIYNLSSRISVVASRVLCPAASHLPPPASRLPPPASRLPPDYPRLAPLSPIYLHPLTSPLPRLLCASAPSRLQSGWTSIHSARSS